MNSHIGILATIESGQTRLRTFEWRATDDGAWETRVSAHASRLLRPCDGQRVELLLLTFDGDQHVRGVLQYLAASDTPQEPCRLRLVPFEQESVLEDAPPWRKAA